MARLFAFGFGYCARALARRLAEEGIASVGTVRDADGSGVVGFGRGRPLPAGALEGATHLLVSIPPDERGDVVLDEAREAIAAAAPRLAWIGYLSTIGVYGDAGGGWVDETTPPAPHSDRTKRRVAAETAWLELGRMVNVPAHIFRLAGIYGPGRSVLDDIRAGTARRIAKPGHAFGRIHVDDIAATLAASMARPERDIGAGAVYNVADDEPAEPAAVVEFACALLGVEPPPAIAFAEANLGPLAASFWAGSRRVRNDKIKRELGVTLAYPTYREGLRAISGTRYPNSDSSSRGA